MARAELAPFSAGRDGGDGQRSRRGEAITLNTSTRSRARANTSFGPRRCYGSVAFARMKTTPISAALLALAVAVACGALLLTPSCNGSLAPGTSTGADGGSISLKSDASISPADASASSGIDSGADVGAVALTIDGCPATQPVDLSTANGRILVPACNAGYAHPNICCRASATQVTECADCRGAPFAACDNASLTFPDPGTCCSLGDGGCAEASVLSVDPGDAAIKLSCYYACGPGGYSPHELQSPTARACSDVADSSDPVCYYCCLGGGCVSNQCSCGACPPSGCGGDNCGACPAGWNVPAGGQYDLCCQTDGSGAARCFSQAGSITYSP